MSLPSGGAVAPAEEDSPVRDCSCQLFCCDCMTTFRCSAGQYYRHIKKARHFPYMISGCTYCSAVPKAIRNPKQYQRFYPITDNFETDSEVEDVSN